MAFQLVIVIIIPIILGIVTISPFEEPRVVEEPEEIDNSSKFGMLYFFLMLIWFFFLIRILFQLKKGTFNISRKY
ncbi:MAG: hypothetical protein KGZ37_00730 [Nitrosarchaeum sp.]|nr:hypothetical protein [Nitrosarchaeum sp.]